MSKFSFLILLIIGFAIQTPAQLTDFPASGNGMPKSKFRGAVHSTLTTVQRNEKVSSIIVEVYDKSGKLIETMSSIASTEDNSGSLVRLGRKTIYIYDANGKLIKEKNFTPEGEYISYDTYIYDAKNRLIETRIYNTEGKETGKRTYTYFPEKREIIATWNFYYDGRILPPMKNLLSFNEKEQWTKRTEYDRSNTENGVITLEYDAQGNFVKEIHCCKYNFSQRYNYKFDKQGNWIERESTRVQVDDNGKEEITPNWTNAYRVITYYSDNETKP